MKRNIKSILLALLLIPNVALFAQRFNVDNKDSCSAFLCKKPWVTMDYKKETWKKLRQDHIEYDRDSIIDVITFYKNGTYTKKVSQVNDAALLNKIEKGTWTFFGEASGMWLIKGDSANYERNILMSAKTKVGSSSYTLRLRDGSKIAKPYTSNKMLCPKFPCLQTDGQKDAGGYYKQE